MTATAATTKRDRVIDRSLGALVVLATLAHVSYYFPRVVDDLFISLRFAQNFAHFRGAVYNVGERVEGYSSPLWMVLQSVGFVLHVDGVTWTKLLGVSALLALEWGLFRTARDVLDVPGPLAFVPSAWVAANSYVVNWSVLGLETPAHLALLVLCPLALFHALRDPSPKKRRLFTAALIGLGTTRPESPMYLALVLAAPALTVKSRAELVPFLRSLARVAAPGLVTLAALLLVRYAYYGYFVPNTYFVKGKGEHFDSARLLSLHGQGATNAETALYVGGTLLLLVAAVRSRFVTPLLTIVACLYFTASVRLDWMPSLRHLLPVTVLAPLGFVALGKELRRLPYGRFVAVLAVVVPGLASADVASVDNRNSPEENRGRGWIRPKDRKKWEDTVLAYRRIEPPHVKRMQGYDMGQITQAWHVLECSSEPVADGWFIGRDIGAVGFYTGVKVYDTAGLFTPEVSHSTEWTEHHRVTNEVLRRAMARRPLAAEFFEGWEFAMGRNPDLLRGYKVRRGSPRVPSHILATDRPPPSPEEVLRRYRALVDALPHLYHLHTLYGESMGAAVEKRLRQMEAGMLRPKS